MNPDIQLKTPRLLLRRFTMADLDDVYEYNTCPEWAREHTNVPPEPWTKDEARTVTELFSNPDHWETGHPGLPQDNNGAGLFELLAIVYQGNVIGEIALNRRIGSGDAENHRVELAYSLSPQHWNQGFTTEAARAVMDRTFSDHDIIRMYAWCDVKNTGSRRVLEKLGMTLEGQLRNHITWNGEPSDQLYYGILRNEWEAGLNR